MTVLGPLVISNTLATSGYFQNTIIILLMGFFVIMWELAIFYKLVAFVLDKRGMK